MLTARQQQILQLIVQLYGQYEEPIGSKTLLQKSLLDVSPATVRNDMLALERIGYLRRLILLVDGFHPLMATATM